MPCNGRDPASSRLIIDSLKNLLGFHVPNLDGALLVAYSQKVTRVVEVERGGVIA